MVMGEGPFSYLIHLIRWHEGRLMSIAFYSPLRLWCLKWRVGFAWGAASRSLISECFIHWLGILLAHGDWIFLNSETWSAIASMVEKTKSLNDVGTIPYCVSSVVSSCPKCMYIVKDVGPEQPRSHADVSKYLLRTSLLRDTSFWWYSTYYNLA